MSTLKLAWRNIWRNPRRTLISMSAVAIGLALVLIYGGLVRRMMGDAKEQLDITGMGHVEITPKGWRARRPVGEVINNPDQVRAALALPAGSEVSARLLSRGLLSSARANEAVEVHGVVFADEVLVASYLRGLKQGAHPAADDLQGVLIGDGLAARMKVGVGQKLRLMAQRADGEMGAQLLRVRGIFHAASSKIGDRRIVMSHAAVAELVGVTGAHQIVIQLPRAAEADAVALATRAQLGAVAPNAEVMTYFEIFPTYAQMEQLVDSILVVMTLFVYFLVGLGILNTMLMSVLERTRELGVLQAIGTPPSGILRMILAESFWIATLSLVIGLTIGISVSVAGQTGLLDYSKEMGEAIDFGGATLSANFKTEASLRATLPPALFVYVMALLVGLYPAWRITRLPVVDALRGK